MSDALTPTGLETQTAEEIKADLDASFKAIYGESIGSEPDKSIPAASSIGQEVALLVDAKASASEMLQAIVSAYDPDGAEDAALDVLCALTGTRRKKAAYSTVLETCFGVIGTLLPAGRVVKVQSLGTPFDSDADATLSAVATTWSAGTTYVVNDLVSANGKIWQCIGAGTSDLYSSGPTGSGEQTDGTVLWYAICATGKGVALVLYTAEKTGPLAATQGQLSQISTPISGWEGAVNAAGTGSLANGLGTNLEGNAALRARRVQELQTEGGGPADAVRAALLAIKYVEAVEVFVNNGDSPNTDGLPPHSVDVMILAPALTDQELANAVWAAVGAGTATSNAVGTAVSKTVVDGSGNPQTVRFSRPTPVPIFVKATVYYDPLRWSIANVNAAIIAATRSALCTFADSYYQTGYQVRVLPLGAAVKDGPQATETDDVGVISPVIPAPAGSSPMPGIVDVDLQIKRTGGASGYTAVSITKGEIATLDPSNCTITPSSEAP